MIGLSEIEQALARARTRVLAGPPDTAMALALYDLGVDPGAAARAALAYAIEAQVPEPQVNGEASAFLMGLVTARELARDAENARTGSREGS